MRRREFVALLGSATAMWSALASPQQSERVRRIGILSFSGLEEFWVKYVPAFKERLQTLGWTEGSNARYVDMPVEGTDRLQSAAGQLIALSPDVIFVSSNPAVAALMRATRSIPLVFINVSDSVGSGFVTSLAHPGGNVTGFHNFEAAIAGKWLEVLTQLAPGVRRVAVVYDPQIAANVAFLQVAEQLSTQGVRVVAARVHKADEFEQTLTAFAKEPGGGLIVAPNPINSSERERLIGLAARLKLPAIYPFRFYPDRGGLASYGLDRAQQVLEAASYVDRILRGTKPGDLPVQLPTNFEFVINLKTAKALDLAVPQSLLLRADEVIQ